MSAAPGTIQTTAVPEFQTLPFTWSWRGVLRAAAIGELLLLLLTIVTLRDLLAGALAVILLVGLAMVLLRGKLFGFLFGMIARVILWRIPEERVGALLLGFLFADIGFYTLTGALTNMWNGIYGAAVLLPASLAVFSVIGFVAAVMVLVKPKACAVPNRATVDFVVAMFLAWSVVMGIGLLGGSRATRAPLPPTALTLTTENMAYSKTNLTGRPGQVTIGVENQDLFWHTFTIEALGVDIKVPMQATQQITFQAEPGVYTFHCTIPGHEILGMTGTLTVK